MTLPSIESVVIIGSGNVATHFAKAIQISGKKIIQIYSKHLNSAKQLSEETDAELAKSIKPIYISLQ
jgi:glutamyl-tRNA reductase